MFQAPFAPVPQVTPEVTIPPATHSPQEIEELREQVSDYMAFAEMYRRCDLAVYAERLELRAERIVHEIALQLTFHS